MVVVDSHHLLRLADDGLHVPHPACVFVALGRTRDREVLKSRFGSDPSSDGSLIFLGRPVKPGALWEAVAIGVMGVEPGSVAATRASSFVSLSSTRSGQSGRSGFGGGGHRAGSAGLSGAGSAGSAGTERRWRGGGAPGRSHSAGLMGGGTPSGSESERGGHSSSGAETGGGGVAPSGDSVSSVRNNIMSIFGHADVPEGDSEDERRRRAEDALFAASASEAESGPESTTVAPLPPPRGGAAHPPGGSPGGLATASARPPRPAASRDMEGILAGLGISGAGVPPERGGAAAAPAPASAVNGGLGPVLCAEDNLVRALLCRFASSFSLSHFSQLPFAASPFDSPFCLFAQQPRAASLLTRRQCP